MEMTRACGHSALVKLGQCHIACPLNLRNIHPIFGRDANLMMCE